MRELKFRLRRDKKVVGYEKWYSGHQIAKKIESINPCWLYSKDGERWNPTFIPHTDKDQFTGLCEIKTRKEIYEKDICENQYGWIGTIIWDSDVPLGETVPFTGWWWKCKEKRDGKFPFHVDKKTKIIGDVFQNKDLLEKKK